MDRVAWMPAAIFQHSSHAGRVRAQGNKQYQADYNAGLQKSNSIVFNAFIFMQVQPLAAAAMRNSTAQSALLTGRVGHKMNLFPERSCCEGLSVPCAECRPLPR